MLNRLQLLRNVGQFDSVSSAAKIDLAKLTLIYAENGRGKTTLSAILRSLATGEPLPIIERHRLGAAHPPEVIIACSGGTQPARFQAGAWTRTCPDMVVFDDVFVDRNVYSGLEVDADHRQNLHELILGEQGVTLARTVLRLAEEIRTNNSDLRTKTAALQSVDHHGLSLDDFCALPAHATVDEAIALAEKRLASLNQAEAVRTTDGFASLRLPALDLIALRALLAKSVSDVDAKALAAVKAHFARLGKGAESWISKGMEFASVLAKRDECPFCLQKVSTSEMFGAYRAHFADSYKELVGEVTATTTQVESLLKGDALAGFERQVQAVQAKRTFWAAFCTVPEVALDTTDVASAWQEARDVLLQALKAKHSDPLQSMTLDASAEAVLARFIEAAAKVSSLSAVLARANEDIERVKEASKAGNALTAQSELKRLKATKERHVPTTAALCADYLASKAAKANSESNKNAAQEALDAHRKAVFAPYQAAINSYLVLFNAGFSVEQVQAQNTAGTPSCTYQLRINAHKVPISGTAGATFKNTLSAGDRNTLALAFFFASLDRDPKKSSKVVVLDDPVSSLDEHRSLATVQEVRKLAQHVAQVVVLSHAKPFLARIWQYADHKQTIALDVARDAVGSTIVTWNVNEDSVTEYDRRHARLREFAEAKAGALRDVASAVRPVLEGYLRVACPADFPPGTLLGPFRQTATARKAAGKSILSDAKLAELGDLTEYANRFHHDTNPAWDTEHINDGELKGYVDRALAFVAA